MRPINDINVKRFTPLISPRVLKDEFPANDKVEQTVLSGRETIQRILRRQDPRLLVIAGPCSIHDEQTALDYAERLNALKDQVQDTIYLVMRAYFEKPRTTLGWKGFINDPCLDGSCDIVSGLRRARGLLRQITEIGMPTATEMLDPITPQYIAGMVCWAAIGARTIESQTHREMASGLSMPVGFKNCTDGGLTTALNAMIAAGAPQNFVGIDEDGQTCIVSTTGNPDTHLVLRGGRRPNYDSVSIEEALSLLREKKLSEAIMVDCSHGNSRKKHQMQAVVWQDVINQRIDGNDALVGLMLESNLCEGQQKNKGDLQGMRYGVSITDACISWETTEYLILSAHEQLQRHSRREPATVDAARDRYKVA